MAFIWVLIPLAGIALAGFSEWLKFKRQTTRLGDSTAEMGGVVASLRKEIDSLQEERHALTQRIQNLEIIVTSEAWDTLGSDPELARAKAPKTLLLPDVEEEEDAQQIARLARRLRE